MSSLTSAEGKPVGTSTNLHVISIKEFYRKSKQKIELNRCFRCMVDGKDCYDTIYFEAYSRMKSTNTMRTRQTRR